MSIENRNILISGASIAGPTLAYWLKRYGFNPTVIERAPKLREGGYAIDIRGAAVDVAERMGVLSRIQQASTDMEGLSFVDKFDKRVSGINSRTLREAFPSRGIEVLRGDLAKILYEKTKDEVKYTFGDSIRTIEQDDEGVEVTFEHESSRRFDLVVGADGLHSVVRTVVFGDESQFERYLGHYVAVSTIDNYLGLDHWALVYNAPGKMVGIYSARDNRKAVAVFIFKQPKQLVYDHRDAEQQKRLLSDAFADEEWEVSRLLEKMKVASDFYFDAVSQIRMDQWSHGRVVLLGDAGYCPALLSGQGTTLAMVGAYILAGELNAAAGNHHMAFKKYEDEFRSFVEQGQQRAGSGANFLVPGTRLGIWTRNQLSRLLSLFVASRWFWRKFARNPKPSILKEY